METLRNYLNSLDREAQTAYAIRCGTTIGYLRKALSKGQTFDAALVRLLDIESGSQVKRFDLRPDVWPELKEASHV